MCRMIACAGHVPGKKLIEPFIKMARGENELHERNPAPGEFQHGDGWGVVYEEDGKRRLYKSELACWNDPHLPSFRDKRIILLHARRASCGEITLANAQPFHRAHGSVERFFCHNGTIYDSFPESERSEGETDSEQFFLFLNDRLAQQRGAPAIRQALEELHSYTSLNCLLLDDDDLYVVNKYDERMKTPQYYTLYRYRDAAGVLYSSERFSIGRGSWQPLSNGQVVGTSLSEGPP